MDWSRLDHVPHVAGVMTPFPHAVSVDDPSSRAWTLMREHGLRHVAVKDGDTLVGVVSHRELAALSDDELLALPVREACVLEPHVVDVSASLDEVVLEMAERRIGSVLVTKGGRLAGIFTATDACRVLGELLRDHFPRRDGDAA